MFFLKSFGCLYQQRRFFGLINTIHQSSNHTNRPIRIHSIVSHRIGEPYRVIQMVAGMLNLGDAGATHVCNCMKVQSAHNPLRYHVVPKAVGNDIPRRQVLNPSRLHHQFEVVE